MLVMSCAVGVLAGVATAHLRLNLGMPGHKALLWMTPLIAMRLVMRWPVAASVGTVSATAACWGVGGNLGGGVGNLPLLLLAGIVLDAAAALCERHRLGGVLTVVLMTGAGGAANVVCMCKRLLLPVHGPHVIMGIPALDRYVLFYAGFGLLAGLLGALAARAMLKAKSRKLEVRSERSDAAHRTDV